MKRFYALKINDFSNKSLKSIFGTHSPAVMFVDKVGDWGPIDDQVDLGKKLGLYLSVGYGNICKRWILC